jgi:hypothetical protein
MQGPRNREPASANCSLPIDSLGLPSMRGEGRTWTRREAEPDVGACSKLCAGRGNVAAITLPSDWEGYRLLDSELEQRFARDL